MQNYVFRSREAALAAKRGQFDLAICPRCGFAHNSAFQSTLLNYDEGYDNTVPSVVMEEYYREIAAYLYQKYSLKEGLIVDVGCGKGTFLKLMSEMFPEVRGLGIDPSYEAEGQNDQNDRIRFIKDFFSAEYINQRPSLVICRHVLEHIPQPIAFLKSISSALTSFAEIPLFFEVPDLSWIVENKAFWDFSYEHCNYFTPDSMAKTLTLAGFAGVITRTGFGDQYIWAEARTQEITELFSRIDSYSSIEPVNKLSQYTEKETELISKIRQKLSMFKNSGWSIALWGMATKGVVFSFLVDPDKSLLDFCVDVNKNKQGHFIPLTGYQIEAPETLSQARESRLLIVVMNPNYLAEIKKKCLELSLSPVFMDANGNEL
jgi:SAM-dependent methyltransferase